MPHHAETQLSPYAPAQLVAMVADVERYPEFLPWCRAARIVKRTDAHHFQAELIISFKHITESYVSDVVVTPPDTHSPEASPEARIEVRMVRGPFEHLTNHWRFEPTNEGTRIHFALDFRFRSAMLEKLIGLLFGSATRKMVSAFQTRADALYGAQRR